MNSKVQYWVTRETGGEFIVRYGSGQVHSEHATKRVALRCIIAIYAAAGTLTGAAVHL